MTKEEKKKSVRKKKRLERLRKKRKDVGAGIVAGSAGVIGHNMYRSAATKSVLGVYGATKKKHFNIDDVQKHAPGKFKSAKVFYTNGGPHYNAAVFDIQKSMAKQITGQSGRYVAIAPGNAAVAAHEIAHLRGLAPNNKLTGGLLALSSGLSSGRGVVGKLMPSYGIVRGMQGQELSNKEKGVMAAAAAPLLLEETRANINALRTLRSMKRAGLGSHSVLPLLASQLSYTAMATAPFVAHGIAKYTRERMDKRRGAQ
jgi:hypothetical protein